MVNQSGSLDQVFRTLSDPTRRDIVMRLVRGPATVGDLARPIATSLPAVMKHLQVLEDCGLIRTQKVGRVRTCSLEPTRLRVAEQWLGDQRTDWERRLDRLGGVLEDVRGEPEPERRQGRKRR